MTTPSGPDAALFESARSKHPEAVAALLGRHLDGLRAFIRLRAGPLVRAKESCSDLVQSVCREVLEDIGHFEYRGEAQFRTWLYKQALHKILNRQRHWQAAKRDVGRDVEPGHASQSDAGVLQCYATLMTPSREASLREQQEAIEAAFDQLPDRQREAITLHRLAGLSYEEIAAQMETTEGAARNLVHRGLARLTMLLGDSG